jgi:hypothetical protein
MRIRFPGDAICSWPLWRASSREKRQRQIEAAPEEMDETAFAEEEGAIVLQKHIASR